MNHMPAVWISQRRRRVSVGPPLHTVTDRAASVRLSAAPPPRTRMRATPYQTFTKC